MDIFAYNSPAHPTALQAPGFTCYSIMRACTSHRYTAIAAVMLASSVVVVAASILVPAFAPVGLAVTYSLIIGSGVVDAFAATVAGMSMNRIWHLYEMHKNAEEKKNTLMKARDDSIYLIYELKNMQLLVEQAKEHAADVAVWLQAGQDERPSFFNVGVLATS